MRKHKERWSKFGDLKGNKFLKRALLELIETGKGQALLLAKNIQVVDSNGRNLCLITPNITKPKNTKLFVVGEAFDVYYEIRLRKSPELINRQYGPLDSSTYESYHKYTPARGGYPYAPHNWPPHLIKRSNVFREPWKMPVEDLENTTGLKLHAFYHLADILR